MIEKTKKECIDCGRCTKNCLFLEKYGIHLKDFTEREDLRYHCFLCDKCRDVCPKDLSGREIALELRRENPKDNRYVQWLKNPYKFRNTKYTKTKDLLYFGCNYPGYYPKTCEKLVEIAKEQDCDYSIDCCKKPIVEAGSTVDYVKEDLAFQQKKVDRLVCLCPNCYHLLKEKLQVQVISIYQWLWEKGIGEKITEKAEVFFPCSDRYKLEIFPYIQKYLDDYEDAFQSVNCCGLGGGAKGFEKEILEQTGKNLRDLQTKNIYTYCSSCAGIFQTYRLKNIKNFLSEILGVHEVVSPDYGKNVIRWKVKRRR